MPGSAWRQSTSPNWRNAILPACSKSRIDQGLFAFLLQRSQRHAEAAQRYQAALALRPGEGRWWFGLGLALEGAGRGDEAKAAFGRARDTGTLSADMLGVIEQKLR